MASEVMPIILLKAICPVDHTMYYTEINGEKSDPLTVLYGVP